MSEQNNDDYLGPAIIRHTEFDNSGTEFSRFLETIPASRMHGHLEFAVTEDQFVSDRFAQLVVYNFTSGLIRHGRTFEDRTPEIPLSKVEELYSGMHDYDACIERAADGYGLVSTTDPRRQFSYQGFKLDGSPFIYTFSGGSGHFEDEIPEDIGAENAPAYTESIEPTDETREHLKREFGWSDALIDGQAYERNTFDFSYGRKKLHFTQSLLRIPETGGQFEEYSIKDQQWVPVDSKKAVQYRPRTTGEKIAHTLRNLRKR